MNPDSEEGREDEACGPNNASVGAQACGPAAEPQKERSWWSVTDDQKSLLKEILQRNERAGESEVVTTWRMLTEAFKNTHSNRVEAFRQELDLADQIGVMLERADSHTFPQVETWRKRAHGVLEDSVTFEQITKERRERQKREEEEQKRLKELAEKQEALRISLRESEARTRQLQEERDLAEATQRMQRLELQRLEAQQKALAALPACRIVDERVGTFLAPGQPDPYAASGPAELSTCRVCGQPRVSHPRHCPNRDQHHRYPLARKQHNQSRRGRQ